MPDAGHSGDCLSVGQPQLPGGRCPNDESYVRTCMT